mmetsp:Transcript_21836/g.37469  ORF Transcript_21836/g.37469 Transcript_21836/m.37469 type:complete len:367 (+) Transcript_21836:482-1582(+)
MSLCARGERTAQISQAGNGRTVVGTRRREGIVGQHVRESGDHDGGLLSGRSGGRRKTIPHSRTGECLLLHCAGGDLSGLFDLHCEGRVVRATQARRGDQQCVRWGQTNHGVLYRGRFAAHSGSGARDVHGILRRVGRPSSSQTIPIQKGCSRRRGSVLLSISMRVVPHVRIAHIYGVGGGSRSAPPHVAHELLSGYEITDGRGGHEGGVEFSPLHAVRILDGRGLRRRRGRRGRRREPQNQSAPGGRGHTDRLPLSPPRRNPLAHHPRPRLHLRLQFSDHGRVPRSRSLRPPGAHAHHRRGHPSRLVHLPLQRFRKAHLRHLRGADGGADESGTEGLFEESQGANVAVSRADSGADQLGMSPDSRR